MIDRFVNTWAIITSLATVCGILYAIRGKLFDHWLYVNRIRLSVDTSLSIAEDICDQRWRYIHLTVSNSKRWRPVSNVMVYLRRVEYIDQQGQVTRVFRTGPVPLLWQFTLVNWLEKQREKNPDNKCLTHPPTHWYRDLGPARICDFGHAVKETRTFTICTAFAVANLQVEIPVNQHIRAFVYAEGDDAVSNGLIIEVRWNGEWSESPEEMKKHLKINAKEVRPFSDAIWQSDTPYKCRCTQ